MFLSLTTSGQASSVQCPRESAVQFAFLNEQICPLNRTQNLQLAADRLERDYGQKIEVEGFDEELIAFQEKVVNILNEDRHFYKNSQSGKHKAPILYDAETNEPIGIIKGQQGHWFVTCEIGDLIAYKLDSKGFVGVPPAFQISSFVDVNGTKVEHPFGVIVKWIPDCHEITREELRNADENRLQAITIFDIQVGNNDRNFGNILVDRQGQLHPIDHDRIFYELDRAVSAYVNRLETTLSKASKNYIRSIDLNRDVGILRDYQIDEGEIANYVIRTTFLKLAAESPKEQKIDVISVAAALKSAKLPTGAVGSFIQNWIYDHPLRKILRQIPEPYQERALKNAFRAEFEKAIASVRSMTYKNLLNRLFRSFF